MNSFSLAELKPRTPQAYVLFELNVMSTSTYVRMAAHRLAALQVTPSFSVDVDATVATHRRHPAAPDLGRVESSLV